MAFLFNLELLLVFIAYVMQVFEFCFTVSFISFFTIYFSSSFYLYMWNCGMMYDIGFFKWR